MQLHEKFRIYSPHSKLTLAEFAPNKEIILRKIYFCFAGNGKGMPTQIVFGQIRHLNLALLTNLRRIPEKSLPLKTGNILWGD